MPKLAIYVPKAEMRQIEKWRKRINFSQVFMQALTREIHQRTQMAKVSAGKLEAAAAYYRRQLTESCQPLEEAGFELGTRLVMECQLAPEQIRGLLRISDAEQLSEQQLAELERAVGSGAKSLKKVFGKLKFDEQSFPGWRQVAYAGVAKGVAAAWKEVCERMVEGAESRRS